MTLQKTFFSIAFTKKVKTTSVPPDQKLFREQIPPSSRALTVLTNERLTGLQDAGSGEAWAIPTFSAAPAHAFGIHHSWQWEPAHGSQFLGDWSLSSLGLHVKLFYYGNVPRKAKQLLLAKIGRCGCFSPQKSSELWIHDWCSICPGGAVCLFPVAKLRLARAVFCVSQLRGSLVFRTFLPNPFWGSFYGKWRDRYLIAS